MSFLLKKSLYQACLVVGTVQAWLAQGYIDPKTTGVERFCIFPVWFVFRGVYNWLYWHYVRRVESGAYPE